MSNPLSSTSTAIEIPDPTDGSALEIVVSIAPPKVQCVFKSGGNAKIAPAPHCQQDAQGSRASNPSLVNAGAGSMQGTRPHARSVPHQGNPTGHTTSSARGSNADHSSTQGTHPLGVFASPHTAPAGHSGGMRNGAHAFRSGPQSIPTMINHHPTNAHRKQYPANANANDKKARGKYKCGKCGFPSKSEKHVCADGMVTSPRCRQGTRPHARSVPHQGNPTGHTTSSARGSNVGPSSTQGTHPLGAFAPLHSGGMRNGPNAFCSGPQSPPTMIDHHITNAHRKQYPANANTNHKKARGKYKCGKCGFPSKSEKHVCADGMVTGPRCRRRQLGSAGTSSSVSTGTASTVGAAMVTSQAHQFLPFKTALLHARSLNLKGRANWREWSKSGERPANIPGCPEYVYKHDGWQGYGHWLGTGNAKGKKDHQFLPFKTALLYARTRKLESQTEWRDWANTRVRPANIPSHPETTYKHKGWQGYRHWLGMGTVAPTDHAVREGAGAHTFHPK